MEAFGDAYGKMLLISSVVLDERGRGATLIGGNMEWGIEIRANVEDVVDIGRRNA